MSLTVGSEAESGVVLQNFLEKVVNDFPAYEHLPPMTAQEYLSKGPLLPEIARGWPGTFWDRDMIYDDHPVYQYPPYRPTAEEFAATMNALAGKDLPTRQYPDDFFSSSVIHGG